MGGGRQWARTLWVAGGVAGGLAVLAGITWALWLLFGMWIALATLVALVVAVGDLPLAVVANRLAGCHTGAEALLGRMAVVTQPFEEDPASGRSRGVVKLDGARWTARTTTGGAPLVAGAHVRVQGIQGLVLEVEPDER